MAHGALPRLLLLALAAASALLLALRKLRRRPDGGRGDHAPPEREKPVLNFAFLIEAVGSSGPGTSFEKWANHVIWQLPFRSLPFTPLLACEPGASVLMARFEMHLVPKHAWERPAANAEDKLSGCRSLQGLPLIDDSGPERRPEKPKTVWAAAHALPRLLELSRELELEEGREARSVVFFGNEMPLSLAFGNTAEQRAATLRQLKRYFGFVAFQVKDVAMEGVSVAPMGLSWGYMIDLFGRWLGGGVNAMSIQDYVAKKMMELEANMTRRQRKARNVLAVGGHTARWLDSYERCQARVLDIAAARRPHVPANSSLAALGGACKSRYEMRLFARTPEAAAAGVELRRVEPAAWWGELGAYRFLLSPMGSAIQTAKTVEALLVLTIPVVQRMRFPTHDELVGMGFPMVVVGSWREVTRNATEAWWERLSPRLESFRRNCLSVEGYWRMITGRLRYCE